MTTFNSLPIGKQELARLHAAITAIERTQSPNRRAYSHDLGEIEVTKLGLKGRAARDTLYLTRFGIFHGQSQMFVGRNGSIFPVHADDWFRRPARAGHLPQKPVRRSRKTKRAA